jgi:hypothetical protein
MTTLGGRGRPTRDVPGAPGDAYIDNSTGLSYVQAGSAFSPRWKPKRQDAAIKGESPNVPTSVLH